MNRHLSTDANVRAALDRRSFLKLGGAAALGAAGASTLAACGGGGGGSQGLQFMYWGSAFEQKAISQMLDKFAESHKGIDVTPKFVPVVNYDTKMSTLVASNTAPDMAYLGNDQLYQLAARGKLLNLYPYLAKNPKLRRNLPSSYFWYGKDKLAGTQLAQGVQLLWFNKDAFSDAGADLPPASAADAWSWDEFVQVADQTTVDDNGKHPSESGFDPDHVKQFGTTSTVSLSGGMYAMVLSNGGDIVDETGTKYTLDSPEAIEAVQKLQDLIYEHRVAPTPAQSGGQAGQTATTTVQLQTRRIAMAIDGDWTLLDMRQSDLPYGVGVLPKHKESVTISGGAGCAIFNSSKNKKQALELFTYFNDPAAVDLFKDGLWMPLQKSYYTDDTKIASWAGGDGYPEGFRTAAIDATLNHSTVWWGQSVKNSVAITQALTPVFDRIAHNKVSAREALTAAKDKVQPLLQGRWPSQSVDV